MKDQLPDKITIGDKYGPAMEITDETEARVYFEKCVRHTMRMGKMSREKAENIERQSLGYYAGYYSYETMRRVERLFLARHPVEAIAVVAEVAPHRI